MTIHTHHRNQGLALRRDGHITTVLMFPSLSCHGFKRKHDIPIPQRSHSKLRDMNNMFAGLFAPISKLKICLLIEKYVKMSQQPFKNKTAKAEKNQSIRARGRSRRHRIQVSHRSKFEAAEKDRLETESALNAKGLT